MTVDAKSSDAYVRMIVTVKNYEKLLAALPDAKYYGEKNIFLLQMLCNDWDANTWIFEGAEDGVYEFRYKEVVAESETATTLPPLFKSITVPGEIDNDHLANLKDVEIIVTAHAMQADGFEDDADAAWAAFDGQNG